MEDLSTHPQPLPPGYRRCRVPQHPRQGVLLPAAKSIPLSVHFVPGRRCRAFDFACARPNMLEMSRIPRSHAVAMA
eukprot:1346570-Rhodomonas_salina.4